MHSKLKLFLSSLLLLCISLSAHAGIDKLVSNQERLTEEFVQLSVAHDSERSFLEDVLRRKNEALREQLQLEMAAAPDDKRIQKVVMDQLTLVDSLIDLSNSNINDAAKQARDAKGEDKIQFELAVQKRIGIMDTYYEQLVDTIALAKQLGLDVAKVEAKLKVALVKRAEFLSNAILYVDSQKKDVERRLAYVSETEKATLTNDIIRFTERIAMTVISLQSSVSLMESLGVDGTDYKQLLLATTGDINTDVLDVDVALGLFEEWLMSFKAWAFENTPSMFLKLCLFLAILYATKAFSKVVSKGVKRSVKHSKMDFSVLMQDFFVSVASKAVIFIGLLVALSQIGIELAPLLTGFGVAGVIIGFALQDTLSNFASGLMILIYRPYDVGDMVKVAGIQGTVKNMSLVSTTVQTIDNQRLVIPNNKIWGDVINNITAERIRRVDMVFGIGYADDIDKAKGIFNDILLSDERVLKEPEAMVRLHTLNESSVDFIVRPWVKTDDYWDVYWDVTEKVKKRLDEEGVSIPFPQRDVHLYTHQVKE
ncbi:mechanosensitive ion channel [Vibrio sp. T187]|uniref:mechanosensitive ion channel family protein n=1 Tax=Vibrio TaxID=662 RepID=UPI0010C95DA3|nr:MULTISPECIES: mechanosensitive ion channel domain-containing protein [Vibrio]MBW3697772.1 mechanosensitive ion channel [Vibrio sp. T187]